MKKKILYIAAIVICLSILAGGSMAYFTATETARNVIDSGGISIEILEQQLVDGQLKPWPGKAIPVMPTSKVSKIVSFRNLEQTAWIRADYTLTVYDADGKVMDISDQELARVILIAPNSNAWAYKDGWWYHKNPVAGGVTTTPLFEEVVFSGPNMDNKYQNSTVVVDVTVQAVQKANNGTTYAEALGWPQN